MTLQELKEALEGRNVIYSKGMYAYVRKIREVVPEGNNHFYLVGVESVGGPLKHILTRDQAERLVEKGHAEMLAMTDMKECRMFVYNYISEEEEEQRLWNLASELYVRNNLPQGMAISSARAFLDLYRMTGGMELEQTIGGKE